MLCDGIEIEEVYARKMEEVASGLCTQVPRFDDDGP